MGKGTEKGLHRLREGEGAIHRKRSITKSAAEMGRGKGTPPGRRTAAEKRDRRQMHAVPDPWGRWRRRGSAAAETKPAGTIRQRAQGARARVDRCSRGWIGGPNRRTGSSRAACHTILVVASSLCALRGRSLVLLCNLLQILKVVRAELVDDAGEELLELLRLRGSADDICVCRDGCLNFRVEEMDHIVVLENVHFLDPRDRVHPEALECPLQPLVIRGVCLVDGLLLSPDSPLPAGADSTRHALELLHIHLK